MKESEVVVKEDTMGNLVTPAMFSFHHFTSNKLDSSSVTHEYQKGAVSTVTYRDLEMCVL